MNNNNDENETITPRKILIPIKDPEPETARPNMTMNPYKGTTETPTRSDTMKQNDELKNAFDSLMESMTNNSSTKPLQASEKIPVLQPKQDYKPNTTDSKPTSAPANAASQGTRFFKFPTTQLPVGGQSHLLHWKNPAMFDIVPVQGLSLIHI